MAKTTGDSVEGPFRGLGEQVTAAMTRLHIPGVAVGIVRGDEEYAAGFGVTNVEHPLPVDADTLFSIGSISKAFTATALMRLLPATPPLSSLPPPLGGPGGLGEGQRLDLDAPVRTYLSDLKLADEDVAARVTMRHLLTHTGGWVGWAMNWSGPRDYGRDALARALPKMAQLPQLAPLGELFSYSNNGYALAGRVLEILTGRPFDTAVTRLVLEPLGMARSCFFARWAISHRVAVGHIIQGDHPVVERVFPWGIDPVFNPAGGLAATVNELLRFARFHLGDGTAPDGSRLLPADVLWAMQTPQVPVDGAGTGYGFGWFVRDVGGVRVASHSGHLGSSICYLTLVPARRFAFAVLANAGPNRLDLEITQWALEHYAGVVTPAAQVITLSDIALQEYAGRYAGVWRQFDLDVTVSDGALAVQRVPHGETTPGAGSPAERFLFCGQDCVVPARDLRAARFDFLRGPDGAIAWFRYGRELYPRQR